MSEIEAELALAKAELAEAETEVMNWKAHQADAIRRKRAVQELVKTLYRERGRLIRLCEAQIEHLRLWDGHCKLSVEAAEQALARFKKGWNPTESHK